MTFDLLDKSKAIFFNGQSWFFLHNDKSHGMKEMVGHIVDNREKYGREERSLFKRVYRIAPKYSFIQIQIEELLLNGIDIGHIELLIY